MFCQDEMDRRTVPWAFDAALWGAGPARDDWMLWCVPEVTRRIRQFPELQPLVEAQAIPEDAARDMAEELCPRAWRARRIQRHNILYHLRNFLTNDPEHWERAMRAGTTQLRGTRLILSGADPNGTNETHATSISRLNASQELAHSIIGMIIATAREGTPVRVPPNGQTQRERTTTKPTPPRFSSSKGGVRPTSRPHQLPAATVTTLTARRSQPPSAAHPLRTTLPAVCPAATQTRMGQAGPQSRQWLRMVV